MLKYMQKNYFWPKLTELKHEHSKYTISLNTTAEKAELDTNIFSYFASFFKRQN